ncbi:MAG: DUF1275 domain-containing protein [Hyphomicrobiales bacterium]|nr:MAG: DUF1275 domain-containing protein [Hyphomicrobiales bacterium]
MTTSRHAGTSSHDGLAPLLAFVASYVDATTFLTFGGFFVAQATGSLVVAGSAFETGNIDVLKLAAIPAFALAGFVTTALFLRQGLPRSRPRSPWPRTIEPDRQRQQSPMPQGRHQLQRFEGDGGAQHEDDDQPQLARIGEREAEAHRGESGEGSMLRSVERTMPRPWRHLGG